MAAHPPPRMRWVGDRGGWSSGQLAQWHPCTTKRTRQPANEVEIAVWTMEAWGRCVWRGLRGPEVSCADTSPSTFEGGALTDTRVRHAPGVSGTMTIGIRATKTAALLLLLVVGVPSAAAMQLKWCTIAGREEGGQSEKAKCDAMAPLLTAQFDGRHSVVCVERDDCHTTALEVRERQPCCPSVPTHTAVLPQAPAPALLEAANAHHD